jgi:hypothetical protein
MFDAPNGSPLARCTYILDQHDLPNGCTVTGELEIDVCRWNSDELFISSMTLDIEDENGNVVGKWYGNPDLDATIKNIARMIENDKKLWGYVYDAAMIAAEENAY